MKKNDYIRLCEYINSQISINLDKDLSNEEKQKYYDELDINNWQPSDLKWRNWIYKLNNQESNNLDLYYINFNDTITGSLGFINSNLKLRDKIYKIKNFSGLSSLNTLPGLGVSLINILSKNESNFMVMGYDKRLEPYYKLSGFAEINNLHKALYVINPNIRFFENYIRRSYYFPAKIFISLISFFNKLSTYFYSLFFKHKLSKSECEKSFLETFKTWEHPKDGYYDYTKNTYNWRYNDYIKNYKIIWYKNDNKMFWFIFKIYKNTSYYASRVIKIIDFGGNNELFRLSFRQFVSDVNKYKPDYIYFCCLGTNWLRSSWRLGIITKMYDKVLYKGKDLATLKNKVNITAVWSDIDYIGLE